MFLRDLLITVVISSYFAGGLATFISATDSFITPGKKITRLEFLSSIFFLPITIACLVLAALPTMIMYYVSELIRKHNIVDWLNKPAFGAMDDGSQP